MVTHRFTLRGVTIPTLESLQNWPTLGQFFNIGRHIINLFARLTVSISSAHANFFERVQHIQLGNGKSSKMINLIRIFTKWPILARRGVKFKTGPCRHTSIAINRSNHIFAVGQLWHRTRDQFSASFRQSKILKINRPACEVKIFTWFSRKRIQNSTSLWFLSLL